MTSSTPSSADACFQGPGEMRASCRALDWSQTRLGPLAEWPQSLRTAAQMVLASPLPNVVLWGENLVQIYNDGYREVMGNKHPAGLGQPTQQCWPEVWHINQPIYQRVWAGESLRFEDALYPITRSGQLEDAWFTLAYSPVLNELGLVDGVLVTVVETTARLHKERQWEEGRRGAIDLAGVGTWELDMKTGVTTYSDLLKALFEFDKHSIEQAELYNPINEPDRLRLQQAVTKVTEPDSNGVLNEEYTIITQQTNRHRLVRAQAKMYFDSQLRPDKLIGTMRDITDERQMQTALEQLVQQRTEELAAANKALFFSNEELTARNKAYSLINGELEEANNLLIRSNDNLQTFAYIASHDLQEPLRKIQQFGNLLRTRLTDLVGEEELAYLERMQLAASRMSTLIRDLLSYSRIAVQSSMQLPVPLATVVADALEVLDMAIQETGAQVQVDDLPVVSGDAGQLGQLFQNLLSNALKFQLPGVTPHIRISSQLVAFENLPPAIKPAKQAKQYYCIKVADNGIGFEEKYLDRIFGVFQRLHGKNQYTGTGVGLAICEKVATNHGGVITARSQHNQGATFITYLPAEQ